MVCQPLHGRILNVPGAGEGGRFAQPLRPIQIHDDTHEHGNARREKKYQTDEDETFRHPAPGQAARVLGELLMLPGDPAKVETEIDRDQAVRQSEDETAEELGRGMRSRLGVGGGGVDADMRVFDVCRPEPEREKRGVQVPLQFLQRVEPIPESGNRPCARAVHHDHRRTDHEQPARGHRDFRERG